MLDVEHKIGSAMRVLATVAMLALALALAACGAARDGKGASSPAASSAALIASGVGLVGRGLHGDGDDDEASSAHVVQDLHDHDFDEDGSENSSFYDADDLGALSYGTAPAPHQAALLRRVVVSYYAAATTANGAKACALLVPIWRQAVIEDYGEGAGPAYARGRTCARVMSLLFVHRLRANERVVLVALRVKGTQALALVGSSAAPASLLSLQLLNGHWEVAEPFALSMP
ncbi:MAG: hypothetical protein ACRDK4_07980 [Solirubrobacteraceae bacterium]